MADQLTRAAELGDDCTLMAFAETAVADPLLAVAVVRLLAIAVANLANGRA